LPSCISSSDLIVIGLFHSRAVASRDLSLPLICVVDVLIIGVKYLLIFVHANFSYLWACLFSCRLLGSCLNFITSPSSIHVLFKREHFLLIFVIIRKIILASLSFLSVRKKVSFCLLGGEVSSYNIRCLRIHGSAMSRLAFEMIFIKIVIVDTLFNIWLDSCELAWRVTEVRKIHFFHLLLVLLLEHWDISSEYLFNLLVE
jgi:hypothetical protein